ncbi:hypothetical protein BBM20_13220 [Vibrio parahaemolyticus]|nr:hypothetical protein BBM20_13220 [Vibrio parahaemolyticus]
MFVPPLFLFNLAKSAQIVCEIGGSFFSTCATNAAEFDVDLICLGAETVRYAKLAARKIGDLTCKH